MVTKRVIRWATNKRVIVLSCIEWVIKRVIERVIETVIKRVLKNVIK